MNTERTCTSSVLRPSTSTVSLYSNSCIANTIGENTKVSPATSVYPAMSSLTTKGTSHGVRSNMSTCIDIIETTISNTEDCGSDILRSAYSHGDVRGIQDNTTGMRYVPHRVQEQLCVPNTSDAERHYE